MICLHSGGPTLDNAAGSVHLATASASPHGISLLHLVEDGAESASG